MFLSDAKYCTKRVAKTQNRITNKPLNISFFPQKVLKDLKVKDGHICLCQKTCKIKKSQHALSPLTFFSL